MVAVAVFAVAPLAAESAALDHAFLSASEKARLASIGTPRRRAQFVAGRLLLRRLLARVHGGDALLDWPLSGGAFLPPTALGRSAAPLYLSISHSAGYVACAASGAPVGVDIEADERTRPLCALADAFCTPAEVVQMERLHGDARHRYFYSLWTLKEARFKRDGGWIGYDSLRALHACELERTWRSAAWVWGAPGFTLAVVTLGELAAPPLRFLAEGKGANDELVGAPSAWFIEPALQAQQLVPPARLTPRAA